MDKKQKQKQLHELKKIMYIYKNEKKLSLVKFYFYELV